MRLSYIVNRLRSVLPKYTSNFTNKAVSISVLSASGTTVTATATTHGFTTSDYVLIKGAKIPYTVSSLTRVGTQATAITSTLNHVVYQENDTVEITGAGQSDYNGTKTLIEPKQIKITSLTKVGNTITAVTEEEHGFVVNAKFKIKIWGVKEAIYNQEEILVASTPSTTSFTYTVQGETTSPATAKPVMYCQALYNEYTFFFEVDNSPVTPATGTIYQLLSFNGGYNGFYKVASTPDVNTFTYTISSTYSGLISPATGTITASLINVDSAISAQRAVDTYTEQTSKYWLYVIPGAENASKNIKELTDANYTYNNGNDYNQNIIYNFDLLLFIPATTSLANGDSWDIAQAIKPYIFKSILGYFMPSDFDENGTNTMRGITYLGSSPEFFSEKAFYVHRFSFQVTSEVQYSDIANENDSFAFRRAVIDLLNKDEEKELEIDVKV